MRRASFWFTATTLSPASRALERGRSVRQYPTHVPDPLSSFAHAVWRFLLRRAAGRYAEHDLSDGIGANSCPCAFHWLCYLLGQPRLSESFSRGAPRGSLWVLQVSFSWPHRELVLRFLREISPQKSISARHKTTKRGRHGQPARVGCDPAIAARAANRRAVPPQKAGPRGAKTRDTCRSSAAPSRVLPPKTTGK